MTRSLRTKKAVDYHSLANGISVREGKDGWMSVHNTAEIAKKSTAKKAHGCGGRGRGPRSQGKGYSNDKKTIKPNTKKVRTTSPSPSQSPPITPNKVKASSQLQQRPPSSAKTLPPSPVVAGRTYADSVINNEINSPSLSSFVGSDNDDSPCTSTNTNPSTSSPAQFIITGEMVDVDNNDPNSQWDRNIMEAVMRSLSNQEQEINTSNDAHAPTTLTCPGIIFMQTTEAKLVVGCEEEVDQMLVPFKSENAKSKTWHFLAANKVTKMWVLR